MVTFYGVFREVMAAQRRADREAERERKELLRQYKQQTKLMEAERAKLEVDLFENRLKLLKSVHKQCSGPWDWKSLATLPEPTRPIIVTDNEKEAKTNLENYHPGFISKILGIAAQKEKNLSEMLKEAIQKDKELNEKNNQEYEKTYQEWFTITSMAKKIIAKSYLSYIEAIELANPFDDLLEIGCQFEYEILNEKSIIVTVFTVNDEIVPKEIKSLTKTDKLSIKAMPQAKFNEIYQDFVCGIALRVAREIFSILPIGFTNVNIIGNILELSTGHLKPLPIASTLIPRETIGKLNFELLDPSDSFKLLVHKMNFRKTSGFAPVELLNPQQ